MKGKDATAVEAIWKDLWDFTMTYGRGGIACMAMSALDIALWDAVGKRANLPLHRLWGHYRSKIPIYGSGCFRGAGGDGMIEKALTYVSQGYKAIKMQVAHVHTLAQDLENVRAHARGGRARHRHHDRRQHGLETPRPRSTMGRKFEEYDIYWLEEPVPADDFAGYQRIAAALDMRVVGGETHFTRYDLRPFFINPCLPILQPDPMRGGMTDLRKIATLADTWGITIAPHLFPELNVHLLASIPNGIWAENMGLLDDLWVDPLRDRGRLHHGAGAAGAWAAVQGGGAAGVCGEIGTSLLRRRHHDLDQSTCARDRRRTQARTGALSGSTHSFQTALCASNRRMSESHTCAVSSFDLSVPARLSASSIRSSTWRVCAVMSPTGSGSMPQT